MSSLFVHVIERDMLAYRRQWMIFLTGFVEPLLYLLSIGVGVGALVGSVHVGGQTVDYDAFPATCTLTWMCTVRPWYQPG